MRNGVRCTQKQDLTSNTAVNCFSEASSMGHRRHDAGKIEKLRTRMQLISKDFPDNMLMILVPAVFCWIHAQKQKNLLTAASKPGQVGTAALLGEQQRVLHHLLRVASRLQLSAQTVLVHGLHHLAAARRWSARVRAFHRGETRHE